MVRLPLPFHRGLRGFCLLVVCLVAAGCARHTAAPDNYIALPSMAFTVVPKQVYSPPGWPEELQADVYIPAGGLARFPAVLMVHGGGWERRSRKDLAGIAEEFAAAGFVVVNVSYRFAPEYLFPAPVHDLQVAMHWVHRNAARFRVDTGRIAAFGYSSGAHLVSLMALVADTSNPLDQPHGGERTRVHAVIAGGTPTDLRKFSGGRLVPQFLGGSLQDIPDVFAAASPVYQVHAEAPPFFLYHGKSDLLVSVDHATDFAEVLRIYGVPVETYLMPLRGHISAFLTDGAALQAAMDFLYRRMGGRVTDPNLH